MRALFLCLGVRAFAHACLLDGILLGQYENEKWEAAPDFRTGDGRQRRRRSAELTAGIHAAFRVHQALEVF